MQVVAVGYIIGVVQDSVETALNSSGDAIFAATAEFYEWRKTGRELPDFLYTKHKLRKMGRLRKGNHGDQKTTTQNDG